MNAEALDIYDDADNRLYGAEYEHGDVTSSLPEAPAEARDDDASHDSESREAKEVIPVCESCAADGLRPQYVAAVHTPYLGRMTEKIVLSWSGGKDSSLALQALRADERYEVVALLTSVTREYDRVSIHGVRRSLLEAQARSA